MFDTMATTRMGMAPVAASPGARRNDCSAAVATLLVDVEAVAAQAPAELPEAVALADAAALLALGERLRAVALARLADVDTRRLYEAEGAPSTSRWVAAQASSIPATEVALARRLATLPCLRSAVETGLLSMAAAARVASALVTVRRFVDRPDGRIDGQDGEVVVEAVVVDGVRQLVCEALGGLDDHDPRLLALVERLETVAATAASQAGRLEAAFVVLATHLEVGQVPAALARLVDAVVPSLLESKAADQHARRAFGLRPHHDGGGWYVTAGELDLETGELLHTLLAAELAVDADNPVDTEAYRAARDRGWTSADGDDGLSSSSLSHPVGGDVSGHCPGPRTLPQRRHDALRNGLRRYLASGATGSRGKTVPQILVTVGLESLHGAPGSLGPVGASGQLLPRSLVRRWWCGNDGQGSAVTRFVLGLGGRVLAASHTARTLRGHERRAKSLETGGHCQGAGCTRGPGHTLIPHHATPWSRCGTTSLGDTVLLCEQTHHEVHSGKAVRLKDGRWLTEHGWREEPVF